jgi:Fe-S-cluster containining protein
VDGEEIERIAEHLGMTPEAFNRRHVRRAGRGRSLLERPDGDCEFLERGADGATRCRIHAVRPVQCRTWPFWKSNLASPEAWQDAARGCPGIDRGQLHALPIIQTALRDNGRRPL